MMQILEELYLLYSASVQKDYLHREEYLEALKDAAECESVLVESLNDKQRELFAEYVSARQEAAVITDRETFIQAFKFGANLVLEMTG